MSDEPATKRDIADLRMELKTELQLKLGELKTELLFEIGHALNVAVEQIGKMVGVVDEKYQDLPKRVAALEDHAADARLHVRPPAAPAKRTRRKK